MAPILLNLLWKEYRELRWNVLALIAITLSVPIYAAIREPEMAWFWVTLMVGMYAMIGGVSFGMGAAAGDRATGATNFLAALPIHPAWLGLSKLSVSLICVQIPILGLALFGGLVALPLTPALDREIALPLLITVGALCATHITLTTAYFGLGQPTELRAAGRGLYVLAGWGFACLCAVALGGPSQATWPALLLVLGPPVHLLNNQPLPGWSSAGLTAFTVYVMLALAAVFVRRYSLALLPRAKQAGRRWTDWFPTRSSSPLLSLALKQISESVPFVASVMGIALLLAAMVIGVVALTDRFAFQNYALARMVAIFAGAAVGGGFLLSLLLGVAAFASDLEPKVNTFWRSRPISPSLWFWVKYFIGLGSLLVGVGLPATLGIIAADSWLAHGQLDPDGIIIAGWIALAWFGIFSAAVVSTCLVRRPLHSGLLAVALVAGALGLAQGIDEGWFGSGPLQHPVLIALTWLTASIAATLIAWWAAVRDIVVFE